MGAEPILIVGGGIGGLTLSRALTRKGIAHRVVERAPVLEPVGAGLTLSAGAGVVLGALGVDLAKVGRPVSRMEIATASGRTISRMPMDKVEARVGRSWALHRGDLHRALLDGLEDGVLRTGTTVQHFVAEGDGVRVTLSDGSQAHYAALIGADGIHSSIRAALWPEVKPEYAGYLCWRVVVDVEGPADPVEHWGRGKRLGRVGLPGGRTYVFATLNAPADLDDPLEGRADRLRQRFAEFPDAVPLFASLTDRDVLPAALEEVHAPHWVAGRVALIGDAAHASTPNLGFGATLAIEDAWVMAELLAERGASPATFTAWEAHRRPRALDVQRRSRLAGQVGQWEGRVATAVRNGLLRTLSASGSTSGSASMVLKLTLGEPAVRKLAEARRGS